MSFALIGFLTSVFCAVTLWLIFSYETTRGVRFAESFRVHVDFAVIKLAHKVNLVSKFLGRDFIRQVTHYLFHTLLRFTLSQVHKFEDKIRSIMRVNKTLAKNAERESVTRTKLEEVALHKVATALTEKQKKAHKDRSLNGM